MFPAKFKQVQVTLHLKKEGLDKDIPANLYQILLEATAGG